VEDQKRILVVDDEEEVVRLTREILESEGYQVQGATSGAEGIQIATSQPPDLILLDINMPEMDGWEVLRVLKSAEETRDVPVAVFTVRKDPRDKLYSLQRGAFDYITKPFGVRELSERIQRIFQYVEEGGERVPGGPG
jgi:CheY-like chemotaxis protein